MSIRWVVRREDPRTVGDIVAKAGDDGMAIAEGRVFVGKKRARTASDPVAPGDIVQIAPKVESAPITILLHDGDLVAVSKPAGIPTIADHGGSAHSLAAGVARALEVPEELVHATSRLDRDVSGVVIFALSKRVRDRLMAAREQGTYRRRYLAIASNIGESLAVGTSGVWDAPIGRAADPRHRQAFGREATPSKTLFHLAGVAAGSAAFALLGVAPITGRTHQIRVHASHAAMPLVGDPVYGGPERIVLASGRVIAPGRIALHAARVGVPGERGTLTIEAPIPPELRSLWGELGGDAQAWDTALSCTLRPE